MKDGIHPKYVDSTITCGCGVVVKTKSTVGDMHIDICASCHPFYSGKQKLLDTAGRVERFRKKYGIKAKDGEAKAEPKAAPKVEAEPKAEVEAEKSE